MTSSVAAGGAHAVRSPRLTDRPIDLASLLEEARASDGGVCTFLGIVRNENGGRRTLRIEYQAYGPMAESEIEKIADGLAREWPDTRVSIRHRVGTLEVGEIAVAIVATSPHRAQAFEACRAAIDRIKSTVPIWKREFHPDGTSDWVVPIG
ncbi:MAG TPA: molybdenum cofactor biosynthesis protein MoaE [Thermoanaerobaculia bacterium]|jgi:molybdopterin synthase catalytic subunit|nr:molybdenum cofactor biosynthesis protein MoaE [Thermoanaerobaculia bacterium]